MNTLKYVLRHGWLWPLEFWMRPFTVLKRIQEDEWKEFLSASIGNVTNGIVLVFLFLHTELITLDKAIVTLVTSVLSLSGVIAIVFAFAGAISGALTFISIVCVVTGFILRIYAYESSLSWAIFSNSLTFLISSMMLIIKSLTKRNKIKYRIRILFAIVAILIVIIYMILFFLNLFFQCTNVILMIISTFMLIIILSSLFNDELIARKEIFHAKNTFLLLFFFWIPSLTAILNPFSSSYVEKKIIFYYFFLAPFLASGFFIYPALLPFAFILYRSASVRHHSTPLSTPLINFWQSIFLPLPKLKCYLALVVEKDIELGYATLCTVQSQSFQGMAARKAAQLVLNGKEGLSVAGYLAINTNSATLQQLLLGSLLARSVAILLAVRKKNTHEEKNVHLSVYERPSAGQYPLLWFLKNETDSDNWEEMFALSQKNFTERLAAASAFLAQCGECTGKEEYSTLLIALGKLATVKDFHQLCHCHPEQPHPDSSSWMNGGWHLVSRLQKHCSSVLQDYQYLSAKEAKVFYLFNQQKRLEKIDWSDLPWFWSDIAEELVAIWSDSYEQEIKDCKEWLLLEISPETDSFQPGNASLSFSIHNKSGGAIAQKVQLHLEPVENIVWCSFDLNLPGLLQGQDAKQLRTDLLIEQPGRYVINGTLTALDLDERSYQWPVNFILYASEKGKPYQLAKKQYYVVGPRLSNDLYFVGRKQLLREIRLLWQEPANKEALLLIGLRRMGKSSLLEKIRRGGVNEKVIPILIDLQGEKSMTEFLQATAEAMAEQIGTNPPELLNQQHVGASFKRFLRSLLPLLSGRYFLLMIDEANFFARRNYAELTHLLRSLMQAPDVPLLLLFCGTYELRQGARDYDSIFYNTTREKIVSYFDDKEAAEVLTRPVEGILEYDPQALRLAFQLTHGHPLLLQALGSCLMQTFDAIVLQGGERSNYVTYGDMEKAGQELSRRDNPAFDNYWQDADSAKRRVLVVMAESLDEISRRKIRLEDLCIRAKELRISIEHEEARSALEQLTQEELLMYADFGYSFGVALYRRWILWHHPPDRFRESL